MKGQAAVELVIILAVSLLVLFLVMSISSEYITQLSSSKVMTEATNSVDNLASAARQVYHQGEGSKQQVFITIPEGEDPTRSGVGNRTIRMNVRGTDVVATTDFDVVGKLPTTPGGYTLWVTAKRGYVLIGTSNLSADPGSLLLHFFSQNSTQSSQNVVTFRNGGDLPILVNLTLNFPTGKVNVSLANPSDVGFTLPAGGAWQVLLNTNVTVNAFGTYSGSLYANSSNSDELTVDIIVEVTSQICANQTCIQCTANCTPSYAVIGTFNDATYKNFKEVFDPSEYVTVVGTGWTPFSTITVDIDTAVGSSVPGYPQLAVINPQGSFAVQWNTAGAAVGTYTVRANDSVNTRVSTFTITACT